MNVTLTAPAFNDPDSTTFKGHLRAAPNLGLYLLAAILTDAGHRVRLIDPIDFEAAFAPDRRAETLAGVEVLGVSANSSTWPAARALLCSLQAENRRPITVLGGSHGSILDEHVLRTAPVDYVVRGEGERALPALLEALAAGRDPFAIPNLSLLRDGRFIQNPHGPLLTPDELAALPLPLFDLLPVGYYDLLPVETSRGCQHACIFCSVTFRRNWRGLAPAAVEERLRALVPYLERTRERTFFFIDDCFSADHDRLDGIAGRLAGFGHPVCFEARITDVIVPGVLDRLLSLPVKVMEMGVECGYEDGLARAGKRLTLPEVEAAARMLAERNFGDRGRFSFVLGLPGETRKDIERTLQYSFKLTDRLGARLIVSWLTVFPGSIIWRKREELGIDISPDDYDRPFWWRDFELFRRCHPALRHPDDYNNAMDYAHLLVKLFPRVRHDGFFREFARLEEKNR